MNDMKAGLRTILPLMALALISNDQKESMRDDRRIFTPTSDEEKRLLEYKRKMILLKGGAKEFVINGKTYIARTYERALKKSKKH